MPKIKLGFRFNAQALHDPKTPPLGSSPEVRDRKKAERAEKAKKLRERSEQIRFRAILKKFGNERTIELGVPREMVDAAERSTARLARKRAPKVAKAEQ